MVIFKCKMCGANLEIGEEISEEKTVCTCEYCGTTQTVPVLDNEKKANLFNRANRLRFNNEFDEAANVFGNIVAEFPEEAEGYWGLCLCKFGIEYVEDPASARRIPTCHRTCLESIFDDDDFKQACENASSIARKVYREEAKEIDRLQQRILEIANSEEPYDIFICYKETDQFGSRTKDSVLAQDIYTALTKEGYKVFFARISLEDKLGQEYEPYIFSALSTARIMLALGTDYDYFNAVWVKNEWSRFLDMKKSNPEKVLIPCYADIDAYDIPREFQKLQAQDMGKVGAIQDLLRGIEKLLGRKKDDKDASKAAQTVVVNSNNPSVESLLKRVEIFLADSDWESADVYCEKVLDIEPENATAYIGKLCSDFQVELIDGLVNNVSKAITSNGNYKKAIRYADEVLKTKLESIASEQKKNIEEAEDLRKKEKIYSNAESKFVKAKSANQFEAIIPLYEQIPGYKDADEKLIACKNYDKERKYNKVIKLLKRTSNVKSMEYALKLLEGLLGYKDSSDLLETVKEKIQKIREEEQRIIDSSNEVYRQYCLRLEKSKRINNKEELLNEKEKNVDNLRKEIVEIEKRLPQMVEMFSRLTELGTLRDQKNGNIYSLLHRKSSLGFFAGKEKKAIDEQVTLLRTQIDSLDCEIESLNQSVKPYKDVNAINQALSTKKSQLSKVIGEVETLKTEIIEERNGESEIWDEEKLYRSLLCNDVLSYIMKDKEKCAIINIDARVKSYVEKNPIKNLIGNDEIVINSELSGDELRKIEKLNYWELDAVKESKEELKERILNLLFACNLLCEYDIEDGVSPASLDAAGVIEKHYDDGFKTWYEENHDDEYDPNTYAKPIDIMISKDGVPKLIIMLYKYGGRQKHSYISKYGSTKGQTVEYYSYEQESPIRLRSRPLAGWIVHWCKDNKVSILNFYAGMPNEAHYILRRVCEVLGEVNSNGYRR